MAKRECRGFETISSRYPRGDVETQERTTMNSLTRVHVGDGHQVATEPQSGVRDQLEWSTAGPMLLRIPEVAAELRLGRSSVYQLIQAGELPVVRIGRAVRVSRADLEAWVDERRREQR